MTTRAERLQRAEALARSQLERQRTRLAKVKSAQREEERRARQKRQLVVGGLVLDTPLASLDDATLAQLFAALARLVDTPDPVATLEGLLCDAVGSPGTPVDGYATAAQCVTPTV